MKKLHCSLGIVLTISILVSCQTSKIGLVTVPSVTSVLETKTVITQIPITTEIFIPMACLPPGYPGTIHYANGDSYGDGYIARVPVKDVAGLNYDEIVKILVVQWLEHYKTQSSIASAAIKDYAVKKISLLDSSCDPFFKFVAGVELSVIPSQVPHDMASFPTEGF